MISRIVSLLAAVGLVGSVAAKLTSTPDRKVLPAAAPEALQGLWWGGESGTDGKPPPPRTP